MYCFFIAGAHVLNRGRADLVIHWAGGMHHSRKSYCVGYAPVNDVVLAILVLLRKYDRVLYVDIDAEHGSGVEEAFYTTDRVMTLSLHEKKSFPGFGN